MKKLLRPLVLVVAVVALAACPSTRLVETWKDPATQQLRFHKVLTVAIFKDPTLRQTVEDDLARRIPGATPSYRVLAEGDLQDVAAAKAKVAAQDFDGAVVMRVANRENKMSYVPGPGVNTFWGYYGSGWPTVYNPGYLVEDDIVTVETAVYDIGRDKLVWSGHSESTNPSSVASLVDGIVKSVAKEMKRQKLI